MGSEVASSTYSTGMIHAELGVVTSYSTTAGGGPLEVVLQKGFCNTLKTTLQIFAPFTPVRHVGLVLFRFGILCKSHCFLECLSGFS